MAIRSARQAVRENPEDVGSYFLLAEAYQLLTQRTRERTATASRQLQLVDLIRRSQRAAALGVAGGAKESARKLQRPRIDPTIRRIYARGSSTR